MTPIVWVMYNALHDKSWVKTVTDVITADNIYIFDEIKQKKLAYSGI